MNNLSNVEIVELCKPQIYNVFFVTKDCNAVCCECAKSWDQSDYNPIVTHGTNWEDDHLYCDNCNTKIDPEYENSEG